MALDLSLRSMFYTPLHRLCSVNGKDASLIRLERLQILQQPQARLKRLNLLAGSVFILIISLKMLVTWPHHGARCFSFFVPFFLIDFTLFCIFCQVRVLDILMYIFSIRFLGTHAHARTHIMSVFCKICSPHCLRTALVYKIYIYKKAAKN